MSKISNTSLQSLFNNLQEVAENSENLHESTFKIRVEQKLHTFMETEYNVNLTKYGLFGENELGPIKLKGAPDAIYGKLIIDYKAVGNLTNQKQRDDIVNDFIEKYLDLIPLHLRKFFRGVLFDGKKFVFMKWDHQKKIWIKNVGDFTKQNLFKFLELLKENVSKNPSAKLLSKTFSLDKSYAKKFILTLYSKLTSELKKENKDVASCFERWHNTFLFLYGSVLSGEKIEKDFAEVARKTLQKKIEIPPFLFTLFTYFTFIIELLCAEVLSTSRSKPSVSKRLLESTDLKNDLERLYRGNFFKQNFKLANFNEGLYDFSWFLDSWDDQIEQAVKSIIRKITEFDFLVVAGLTSRDVLKGLYEKIVPKQIRHDLGEIFTPDWLVELVLNRVGYHGNPDHTLLDPGCGRGVFLTESIARVIKANKGTDNNVLIQKIIKNIVGFDINPIAILTARTNYLISMLPLLSTTRKFNKPIFIPVYLTDSILTPTTEDISSDRDFYKLSTTKGTLKISRSVVDKWGISKFTNVLKPLTATNHDKESAEKIIIEKLQQATKKEIEAFWKFYDELRGLSEGERNAITTMLENFFAPLKYLQHFDFVVGNPPWIKWEFLPKEYKKKLSVLYLKVYKLFSHRAMKAGIGYAHDDISIVFTYVALDKYLKVGGTFAFLLKQTLYKSLAGKEFRKFLIEKVTGDLPLKVMEVHDFVDIRPFAPTQSETSLIVLKKGSSTTYPVPYYSWTMKSCKSFSEISKSDNLKKVRKLVNEVEYDAYPDPSLQDVKAPWVIVKKSKKPPKVPSRKNPYDARHGIVDDLDAVFQVRPLKKVPNGLLQIQNMQRGKRKVQQVTREVESDLIFPLLKPKNVKRWVAKGYDYVILPQRKYGEENEEELRTKYPHSYKYLNEFKSELLKRTSRWFKDKPFYTVFGLGDYTFKPYKVVWSAIGYLPDFAVTSFVNDTFIDHKVVIPDNTICFIPLDSKREANFLCALLNSSYVESMIGYRSTKSKWGVPVKLIKQIPLPRFNPAETDHQKLSSLTEKAQQFTTTGMDKKLLTIESEINKLGEKIIKE